LPVICSRDDQHLTYLLQLWIVPLQSWYEESFDNSNDSHQYAVEGWSDHHCCVWPKTMGIAKSFHDGHPHASISTSPNNSDQNNNNINHSEDGDPFDPVKYFLQLNLPHLQRQYDAPVVTFSHFLPRRELLPARHYLFVKFLPKVCSRMQLCTIIIVNFRLLER
jgi:hypothetical protein